MLVHSRANVRMLDVGVKMLDRCVHKIRRSDVFHWIFVRRTAGNPCILDFNDCDEFNADEREPAVTVLSQPSFLT